jgi:hypothetical protein
VTVTDSKGNPVKDLKPEDFEVYETAKNRKSRTCNTFRASASGAETVKSAADDKLAVPVRPRN